MPSLPWIRNNRHEKKVRHTKLYPTKQTTHTHTHTRRKNNVMKKNLRFLILCLAEYRVNGDSNIVYNTVFGFLGFHKFEHGQYPDS